MPHPFSRFNPKHGLRFCEGVNQPLPKSPGVMNVGSDALETWDTMGLLYMTLPIMGHVVLARTLILSVGRDTWISSLLALPVGCLTVFLIWFILRRPNGEWARLPTVLGGVIYNFLRWLLVGYFLFLTITTVIFLVALIHAVFLPQTPVWAITIWFGLFAYYAAAKGINAIARTAVILGIISFVLGYSVTAMSTPLKHWEELKPLLEHGWIPVLDGVLRISSMWSELIFLLLIPLRHKPGKGLLAIWLSGIFLNTIMTISTPTGAITIFGLREAQNMLYPATEGLRIISLGFIDRFDIYALLMMSFGCYIRTSLYARICVQLILNPRIGHSLGTHRLQITLLGIMVLILSGAIIVAPNASWSETLANEYQWGIFMLSIPVLLLLVSELAHRKCGISQ